MGDEVKLTKICVGGEKRPGCYLELTLDCFGVRSDNGKHLNICINCDKKYKLIYYEQTHGRKENPLECDPGFKQCKGGAKTPGCGKILNLDCFYFISQTNKHQNICKNCQKEYKEIYYKENAEEFKEITAQYVKDNPEKVKECNNNYYQNNKQKRNESSRQWRLDNPDKIKNQELRKREKQKNNINYKLKKNISRSIHRMLKENGSSKNGQSILNFVPWTTEQLKVHIESQFPNHLDNNGQAWMNWENRGTYKLENWNESDSSTWVWHIDHIIPHSKFKYTTMDCQEFRDCWALSNLRPLRADINVKDGARR